MTTAMNNAFTVSTEDIALALYPSPAELIVLREALIAYRDAQAQLGNPETELRALASMRLLAACDYKAKNARPRVISASTKIPAGSST